MTITPSTPNDAAMQAAVGEGLEAFWAAVARRFPEITTGDVGFDDPFTDHAEQAVARWYADNRPAEPAFSNDQLVALARISGEAAMGDWSHGGTVFDIRADLAFRGMLGQDGHAPTMHVEIRSHAEGGGVDVFHVWILAEGGMLGTADTFEAVQR